VDSPILIGIHGVKRAGKDTTATFIREWVKRPTSSDPALSVVKRGFADKAKWAYARQFFPDCTMAEGIAWVDRYKETKRLIQFPDNDEGATVSLPFRLHMAQFATDSARDIYGKDHWVDQLLPLRGTSSLAIRSGWWDEFLVEPGEGRFHGQGVADICLITDNRFENELARIEAVGGLKVKVKRRDAELAVIEEARREGREVHSSELGLPDEMFDVVLVNDDNNMDNSRRRTFQLMGEIESNGIASIRAGTPLPWVIR
jgi:hypothetical protein